MLGQDASHVALAVGLAGAAALAFAVATVTEQRAAARSSDRDARGRKFLGQLVRNPRWLAAMGGNVFGWLVVTLVVTPLVVGCLVISHPLSGAARAGLLAIAVGLLGGVLAVLTKAVVARGGQLVVLLLSVGVMTVATLALARAQAVSVGRSTGLPAARPA